MAIASARQDLVEALLDVFSRLPNGLTEEDIRIVRHLAAEEASSDIWSQTATLDKQSRICLMAAVAYTLHGLKNDPYKCSVFSRATAEALLA